ncbi:hypothetical protein EVAR_59153_1 [Eumeta japonica]|uniref:Uncharacterized protein n=1 Tax=Eumeta variegata TaxID=151549 RepID=A0A4C1YXY8_EUMVA|nr:hypothetical protein EVAR_59153_1 [Eumeta japonica]
MHRDLSRWKNVKLNLAQSNEQRASANENEKKGALNKVVSLTKEKGEYSVVRVAGATRAPQYPLSRRDKLKSRAVNQTLIKDLQEASVELSSFNEALRVFCEKVVY